MRAMFRVIVVILLTMSIFSCGTKSTNPDDEQVANPTFSPNGGVFSAPTTLLIACATSGSVIRYTLDNSEPSGASTLYSGVINISANTTVKAKAFKSGWISSSTRTAVFYFSDVAPPVMVPAGGTYTSVQSVSMICETPNAQIRYTTDGSIPNDTSNLFLSAIPVTSNTNLQAIAFLSGSVPSPTVSETYNMQVLAPQFSLQSGSYGTSQTVTITCATANAQIRYTINGLEPTESSDLYSNSLNILSNTIVKARAFKTGWNSSLVSHATYLINISDQMVAVSGGSFSNGTSSITLDAYYIGKYEVTQFEWMMIMGTHPSFYPENSPIPVADLPVERISWFDAIEYCNRRSLSEGYTPSYSYDAFGTNPSNWPSGWNTSDDNQVMISCNWDANGYRLPSEMEWMFAAQGGNYSHAYTYSGSNSVGDVAWYSSNSNGITSLVGTKQANELGLYDMSGNVWEFCWDIFGSYATTNQTNPIGPAYGTARVIRGGCCLQDESNSTVARRFNLFPNIKTQVVGFRVVRKAISQ